MPPQYAVSPSLTPRPLHPPKAQSETDPTANPSGHPYLTAAGLSVLGTVWLFRHMRNAIRDNDLYQKNNHPLYVTTERSGGGV